MGQIITQFDLLDVEVRNPAFKRCGVIERLMESISREGLWRPIVIGHFKSNTKPKKIYGQIVFNNYDEDPNEWFAIQCGHNRLEACKRLGFRKVPCVIVNSSEEAVGYCKEHRKLFNERYDTTGLLSWAYGT